MPENSVISITDMTQKAYDCVKQENLSEWSYQKYWYSGIVPIRRYCKEQQITVYSPESIQNCVKWFQGQLELGFVKDAKFQKVRKIAQIMETLYNGETYQWNCITPRNVLTLPIPYLTYIDKYEEFLIRECYKESTIRGEKPIAKHFLTYVVSLGHEDIQSLTPADIVDYIPVLAKDYQRVDAALSILRKFGGFLYDSGFTRIPLDKAFSVQVPIFKKLHFGFTSEETARILTQIDRSTKCGKRDYAILMLAMHTGLRGVDVLTLTFDSIDWNRRELHLIQSKTSHKLTLPVPINVLNAIADYILYARPESAEKSIIFLRERRPYTPLKTWSAHSIVKRRATQAGVRWDVSEWKGFHSFRRGIANRMLDAEVPLEMITEVLGQTNTDSTKPYIAVHQSGLSNCALDLRMVPLGREELM